MTCRNSFCHFYSYVSARNKDAPYASFRQLNGSFHSSEMRESRCNRVVLDVIGTFNHPASQSDGFESRCWFSLRLLRPRDHDFKWCGHQVFSVPSALFTVKFGYDRGRIGAKCTLEMKLETARRMNLKVYCQVGLCTISQLSNAYHDPLNFLHSHLILVSSVFSSNSRNCVLSLIAIIISAMYTRRNYHVYCFKGKYNSSFIQLFFFMMPLHFYSVLDG